MIPYEKVFGEPGLARVGGVPEGYDALLLAEAAARVPGRDLILVARDEPRMMQTAEALAFFGLGERTLAFPAWDCLPYDRVSPNPAVLSRRLEVLLRLAAPAKGRRVLLTTVAAATQRVPLAASLSGWRRTIAPGGKLDPEDLARFLSAVGYMRVGTVSEPGDFALRGGIVDVFPTGAAAPVRIDLFGDEIEALRTFDPLTQRSTGTAEAIDLLPMSEVVLDEGAIRRFRQGYQELFGTAGGDDPLYAAISAGQRHPGMEHWLPLFHERLATIFDYLPGAAVVLDHHADDAREARDVLIAEHHQARLDAPSGLLAGEAPLYRPVPPDRLFLGDGGWQAAMTGRPMAAFSPLAELANAESGPGASYDAGARQGRTFAAARTATDVNLFDAVRDAINAERGQGRRVVVVGFTDGSRDRIRTLLTDHGVGGLATVAAWREVEALPRSMVALATLGLEHGFETADLVLLAEQDILGDRLARPARRPRKAEAFLAEVQQIAEGDLVVHVEHGVGRYEGLQTLQLGNAPHDCLKVVYDGGDRLFVPVENIEVLSRYGPSEVEVALDKLGAAQWQQRKARLKKRIAEMAGELLKVAAERRLRAGPPMLPPEGLYEEFCARFPYAETEDQARAIADVLEDLATGMPMDRLICGDVGFGKTEVAMRAAFLAAMSGTQVAVIVPTTLLARQHARTFRERFANLPIRVEQLSRFVPAKKAKEVKQGLQDGTVEIVIGTHALLAKDIGFKELGLLVIDEEQHFGVRHKEALKRLKADVHVLTLTATPIPRTLQMALVGVREMSVIATPPVDRLAVRTYVTPFDPVTVREAIMRERFRGGQSYYVAPRISDLETVAERLRVLVPEVKFAVAHGKLTPTQLEAAMGAFYDGEVDVLLSTAIVESGLDIPRVNTMVVHRADMFGLAQLYQLRGRIGRAKLRAYAYLTLPNKHVLGKAAEQRLGVLQRLDNLGAGFSLASHDLDIRGAGNLLGEEQSGHIKEVGVELYQQMLEEAVAQARAEAEGAQRLGEGDWSPQINLGTAVLIPEEYVADLDVRLGLYRRIGAVRDEAELNALAVELADRFGPLPDSVNHLLDVVAVKQLCRQAGVQRFDAGDGGAIVTFRNDSYANPAGLVAYIAKQAGTVKLRPDHRLVVVRPWSVIATRVTESRRVLTDLARVAAEGRG